MLYVWPQKHKRTQKVSMLTTVCWWYRARKIIPAWGVSGCSGVAAKGGLCVSNGRGGCPRSVLQTQCYTLQYEQSHRLLTFTLLVLQDQNNKATSHTWNSACSIPKITSSWKKKWNDWVDNKQGAVRKSHLPKATLSVTKCTHFSIEIQYISNECITCKLCVSSQIYKRG